MEYFQIGICLILIQQQILSCLGMCDQRKMGGELKCCKGKDSKCFTKVQSRRSIGQRNTICYCDSYCKFTKDCCEDYDKIQKLCNNSRDCRVSSWEEWSECNADCGIGIMRRKRKVLELPTNDGKKCPSLRQIRGCNNDNCPTNNNNFATILPISYRRPPIYRYENILPAMPDEVEDSKNTIAYSYCVHYRLTFKMEKGCENTWAQSLVTHTPICVECQSRVMDNGHCRGEGALGVRTRWKALGRGLERCYGDWIRLGPVIQNCVCSEHQFANFVFV